AARLALVAGRHATAPAVGRLVEAATGGRPGSIVGLVAATTPAGASAQLWTLADRKAVAVVDGAALAVGRLLARDTRTSLLAATVGTAARGPVPASVERRPAQRRRPGRGGAARLRRGPRAHRALPELPGPPGRAAGARWRHDPDPRRHGDPVQRVGECAARPG